MRLRVSLVGLLLAACLLADDLSAWEIYAQGRSAEKAGHMAQAYLLYAKAAAMEPRNKTYWARAQALQSRAALENKLQPTLQSVADLEKDLADEPEIPLPTDEDLAAAREPLPPTTLDANQDLRDLDFTGDYKKVFQDVAHAYGLDCVFDSDFQAGTPFRFRLKNVDYRDALNGLQMATGSFVVPITPAIFLVAKDTPQKRTEIEPTVTMSVPLPDTYTAQDFNDMVRDVQQTMAIEKVGLDPTTRVFVMRDRISKVMYARALLEEMMHSRAQVGVEMRFLEITRNDAITYGFNFPSLFTLNALTTVLNNTFSLQSGLSGLLTFGGGKTLIGIGIASPALIATLSKSEGKLLLASQLRSLSGQKATIHVGERYPIETGGYGNATSAVGRLGVTPAPSFTFQDLGLTLTTTPTVHDAESVSLDLDAQFQVLTGESINGLPVISSRSVKNVTRLKFGEWAVIAGLMTTNEARTISGIPGIANIPFLGALTATRTHNNDKDEVLVLLRPVLLSNPPNQNVTRTFRTGTENRPLIPL